MAHPSATFVYVSLGPNAAPTLSLFAQRALDRLPGARAVLVTDRVSVWEATFPGSIIAYKEVDRHPALVLAERREVSRRLVANGYWILTLERLFALRSACDVITGSEPVIHLESDSLSQVDADVLAELQLRCTEIAVPSDAALSGCASILFSPDGNTLKRGLDNLSNLLLQQTGWISDMKLLGLGIKAGVVQELPTRPENGWPIGRQPGSGPPRTLVFDALALGLYLFGRDPLHTGGKIVGGYQHAKFEHDLSQWKWMIAKSKKRGARGLQLAIQTDELGHIFPGNLHVHSKEVLPELSLDSEYWSRLLEEANGTKPRLARPGNSPYRFQRLSLREKFSFLIRTSSAEKKLLLTALVRKMSGSAIAQPDSGREW